MVLKLRQLQKAKKEQENSASSTLTTSSSSSASSTFDKSETSNANTTVQKGGNGISGGNGSKIYPAMIRVQKDITELSLPPTIKLNFPNPDDLMNFELLILPNEGFYKNGKFKFTCSINNNFPIEPPKFKCLSKIYHPNIDLEGNVCLNILREDWRPVLSLNAVLIGLQFLFLEPNANDPLNKDAANDLNLDKEEFKRNVYKSMRGGYVKHEKFDNVL
ncbi:hypothetical protein PACTADRAFT_51923 [Pachysolen tannophilus NRRL Y-2460]|uniref:NEDD8-conjugating enzyme UBC12 n=1 Tax=Pachysolen tannophilus NRRL Y-2460 TaxID=669874 RepID=A0A1E4TNK3_PACTA|nr:hypothetical protein PACTADRAFT_51923 [Pachysolen tannophilus NRRL Y-2460]